MTQQLHTIGQAQRAPLPSPSPAAVAFPGRVLISPQEFAQAANISRTRVYQEVERGKIGVRRVGVHIKIPLAELDRWLAALD